MLAYKILNVSDQFIYTNKLIITGWVYQWRTLAKWILERGGLRTYPLRL